MLPREKSALKGTINIISGSPGTCSVFFFNDLKTCLNRAFVEFLFSKILSTFRINYKASPVRYFNDFYTSSIYICIGFCFECAWTCLTSYTIFLL